MSALTRTAPKPNGHGHGHDLKPVTVPDFLSARTRGQRLSILTAYDYTTARLLDSAGVDGILVGDSLGMVVQGQPDTLGVTVRDMCYHGRCVAAGLTRAHLTVDLPFMSYQVSVAQAMRSGWAIARSLGVFARVNDGASLSTLSPAGNRATLGRNSAIL